MKPIIPTTAKVHCLGCDPNTYLAEVKKFENDNIVYEKHVSSQMAQMQNPQYVKGITSHTQPEYITALLISVVFVYEPKPIAQA